MPDRITIRMSPDLIQRLDEWIASQAGFVSRQEAIRQLLASALDHQSPQNVPYPTALPGPNDLTLSQPAHQKPQRQN